MKKTDKKIEKRLISALTHVCDCALESVEGFKWLTHDVNYSKFPESLSVICVFDSIDGLNEAMSSDGIETLYSLISHELKTVDIQIRDVRKHVRFDTEEECNAEHGGKWNVRLRSH